MHYQYISICRGGKSIVDKLKESGIDPDQYIRFYSLRSYDRINRSKLEELLVQAAGYSNATDQQLSSTGYEEDAGRRAHVIHHAGDPDFAQGTAGDFNAEQEVEYGRIREENEYGYRRNDQELEDSIARDSIANDAMEGGDIESEPWVNDTKDAQPRDDEAEREEASDYVTEELYIHAKLLIVDGRWTEKNGMWLFFLFISFYV